MSRYFSYISHSYNLKNNLYKMIYAFLCSHDRMIIEPDEIEDFKKEILDGIKKLNASNSRCNAIDAHWFDTRLNEKSKKDFCLTLGYGTICCFNVYQETTQINKVQKVEECDATEIK